jgi:sodium transport system permease protein
MISRLRGRSHDEGAGKARSGVAKARSRIGAIYRKELLDVLRDRRTLTAMIVIPVVLYPVVMLLVMRAAETEQVKLATEQFTVEVPSQTTAAQLADILREVSAQRKSDDKTPRFDIQVGQTPSAEWGDRVHAQVELTVAPQPPPLPPQLSAKNSYNEVNIRSQTAMNELQNVLNAYRDILTRRALASLMPGDTDRTVAVDQLLRPVEITAISTATERQRGGWALGHIIPIILVLMTITGAIYPAIDLTAGERERGTLETVMATPVPTMHLILGKFFVVATIGMITAALNVASVGATMQFSGITKALSAEMPVQIPLSVLPIVLLCLIPFALLFSAVLLAVCSFARTFKEAQNYIMPVMVISLIPAFTTTMPSVRLERGMLVMPIGNMVLLARELLQGTFNWTQVAVVVLSTTLYAAAAIAIAAKLFGQEAVLFADTRSYRTLISRRFFEPADRPNASQALLLAAILFPASFYAQTLLADTTGEDFARMLGYLAIIQFVGLLVLVPVAYCTYLKIDAAQTLRLHAPSVRSIAAAILIGLSAWVIANEFASLQQHLVAQSKLMEEFNRKLIGELSGMPLPVVLVLIAVVPAVCEELFFRGFLLSGLGKSLGKWNAILLAALIFGIYHFIVDKLPITTLLGILLGYICWQTRSILPGMIVHALHNAVSVLLPLTHWPDWTGFNDPSSTHLPWRILVPAVVMFLLGLLLIRRSEPDRDPYGEFLC